MVPRACLAGGVRCSTYDEATALLTINDSFSGFDDQNAPIPLHNRVELHYHESILACIKQSSR